MSLDLSPEISVAGAVLLDPGAYRRVEPLVSLNDFQQQTARAIFGAAAVLDREGIEIDPLTVRDQAKRQGNVLEDQALVEFMEMAVTSANVEYHAGLVRKAARERALREIAADILTGDRDPDELISDAGKRLEELQRGAGGGRVLTSADMVHSFYDNLQERENGKENIISSGFPGLDNLLGGGFLNGGLYLLAARPGMGKTALALNIADNVPGPVLFVSLEMAPEQITARRLARLSGISSTRLLMGTLDEQAEIKVADAALKLADSQLFLSRGTEISVADLSTLARSIQGLRAVFVDYLGLMKAETGASRYESITQISGGLKRLAVALNVPIVALAQLSRKTEDRTDKRPALSDLRDSGALEQDADGVMLLFRSDYYEGTDSFGASLVELDLAKNRHGRTGQVCFRADLSTCRFWEVDNG